MLNPCATPQIYIMGRIVSACGFDSNELFLKYKIILGENFEKIDGILESSTFQSLEKEEDLSNCVYFDQPINLNVSCRSVRGWPKIYLEVWINDREGRNCLGGYGTAFFPCKSGNSKISVNCWRPADDLSINLSEALLGKNAEFLDKTAIYSSDEKFGIKSRSTGQVNIEVDMIFKDFLLHGIDI